MSLLLALLIACGPSFTDIQMQDTIEAYEGYLAEHPMDKNTATAKKRIEELYLEKARKDAKIESYDAYLAKYKDDPQAKLVEDAVKEREEFLFNWAAEQNTPEAWDKYLTEYEKGGSKKKKAEARQRKLTAAYMSSLEIGPVEVEPCNLAEDPNGPLDGFCFHADITNKGDKTVKYLNMHLEHLNAEGKAMATETWPWVAPKAPGNMPIEEEWKVPVKPGETRAFVFSSMAPEGDGWVKKSRLVPLGIQFVEDAAPAAEE